MNIPLIVTTPEELSKIVKAAIQAALPEYKAQQISTDPLLSKAEAAKHFGISTSTIDNHRRRGIIKGIKVGQQIKFDLDELINAYKKHNGLN